MLPDGLSPVIGRPRGVTDPMDAEYRYTWRGRLMLWVITWVPVWTIGLVGAWVTARVLRSLLRQIKKGQV